MSCVCWAASPPAPDRNRCAGRLGWEAAEDAAADAAGMMLTGAGHCPDQQGSQQPVVGEAKTSLVWWLRRSAPPPKTIVAELDRLNSRASGHQREFR